MAEGLRPFTVHATERLGLRGITQLWKPESGNWELVRPRNVTPNESTYDPGDGLLDVCLFPIGPTQCAGIFIWQDRPGIGSKLVIANDFADQTDAMKRLDAEGWYPVSLAVAVRMGGNPTSSSCVWHRKLHATDSL
ncbi:MAG: hypothetical protein ACKVHE_29360 [Planctomycetales bacterium]